MKFRTGFVSNSSSSSFCIYGCYLSSEEFEEKTKKYLKELHSLNEDEIKQHISNYLFNDNPIKGTNGSEIFSQDVDYSMYVGKSWSSIEDNITGKEFKADVGDVKERIENNLKKKGYL